MTKKKSAPASAPVSPSVHKIVTAQVAAERERGHAAIGATG